MRFCSECGSDQIHVTMPYGDIGLRYVCTACDRIHYQRHSVVAGCVATHEDRILLCRRAIEPYRGLWTVPAGYVEIGETMQEAATRETHEEAQVTVIPTSLRLLALYNLPMFAEIYVLFAAQLKTAEVAAGPESLEARLFKPTEIDWQSLAFPMVREVLRRWMIAPESRTVAQADFFWGPDGAVRVRRQP